MARTLDQTTVMWPYNSDESDYLSLPKQERPWKMSDWYWERYKDKCLNEIAPLEDLTETEQPFRFAA